MEGNLRKINNLLIVIGAILITLSFFYWITAPSVDETNNNTGRGIIEIPKPLFSLISDLNNKE